jgi:ASC-1-like (ASCH) protein
MELLWNMEVREMSLEVVKKGAKRGQGVEKACCGRKSGDVVKFNLDR